MSNYARHLTVTSTDILTLNIYHNYTVLTFSKFSGESLGMGINHGGAGGHNNNVRLQLGMFTIFPANGVVLPGSSATVTVDMFSEIAMVGEEVSILN